MAKSAKARAVRCRVKSATSATPVLSYKCLGTAGGKPEEGGDDVKSKMAQNQGYNTLTPLKCQQR